MKEKRFLLLAVGAVLLSAVPGWAIDTVRLKDGQELGNIVSMSPQEVSLERGGQVRRIPANQIELIFFGDEPSRLKTAKTAILAGRLEDALETLESIQLAGSESAQVKQDLEFYTAYCKARIALANNDPNAIKEAGKLMVTFVQNNPQSYHFYRANELIAEMLVALENYQSAETYYQVLSQAPWPDTKAKALVSLGMVLLAQGKVDEAAQRFAQVEQMASSGGVSAEILLANQVGKARCLVEKGQADQAVKSLEAIVNKVPAEDTELSALLYNSLGLAYEKLNKPKAALLAFLHTHTLYFKAARYHVEALEHLAKLFTQIGQPDRAQEMAQVLQERYNRTVEL